MSAPTSETELWLAALQSQRRHVLGILDGLDDEALRRPVLPSGWSCQALLHHLAEDDEAFWFQAVVAGDEAVVEQVLTVAADGWTVPDGLTGDDVRERYRAAGERTDAILAAADLDAPPAWWPDFFADFRLESVREVALHLLTETATHAGHLDAARELLDGRQWLVVG